MIGNNPLYGWDKEGCGDWKHIPGANNEVRGPEKHTSNGKVHGHVQGYKRQFFPDGSQEPHGSSGKDKDIPKKLLEKAIEIIFKKFPLFIPPIFSRQKIRGSRKNAQHVEI